MSMFSGIGNMFGGGMDPGRKLAPGNEQWSQLANFFPDEGKTPKGSSHQLDIASILSAIQGQHQEPPPAPAPPEWLPPPPPHFLGGLQSAPQLGRRQMMPPPAWMQPYLWGGQ